MTFSTIFETRRSAIPVQDRYVLFADQHDSMSPDYARALVACADRSGADIVSGNMVYSTASGLTEYSLENRAAWQRDLIGRDILTAFLESGGVLTPWLTLRGKLVSTTLLNTVLEHMEALEGQAAVLDCDLALLVPLYANANALHWAETCGRYIVTGQTPPLFAGRSDKDISPHKAAAAAAKAFAFIESYFKTNHTETMGIDACFRAAYAAHLTAGQRKGKRTLTSAGKEVFSHLGAKDPSVIRDACKAVDFFRGFTAEYKGVLENTLKPLIHDPAVRCVSFDLFDTLVCRPFHAPSDLFHLLDKKAESLCKSNTPFHQIRKEAEEETRKRRPKGTEEITLDAIYETIHNDYLIEDSIVHAVKAEERRLELQYCRPRRAAREIFDYARHAGKMVIITSDMYLDAETVEGILMQNGYGERDALFLSSRLDATKHSGTLFNHVLTSLALRPEEILHIGDNRHADYDMPRKLGIRAFHFPRAVDVLASAHSSCLDVALKAAPSTMRKDTAHWSLGYRTGVAIAANRYFDDPFREFQADSDFNGDPFFIGYYPLGMHLLALSQWLNDEAERRGYRKINYNARDGYLPMLYHRRLREAGVMRAECDYVYGSRVMVQAALVEDDHDFMRFIRVGEATPRFFLNRFAFCLRDVDAPALLARNGIGMKQPLTTASAAAAFLKIFLEHLLDREKLEKTRDMLRRHFEPLTRPDEAVFDVGYGGSMPSAVASLTGKQVNVLYVHADKHEDAQRMHGFSLDCFYPFVPGVSGALREFLLSESAGACIGVEENEEGPTPIFSTERIEPAEKLLSATVHRGALTFLDEYLSDFAEVMTYLPASPLEMSLPFEGYLHFPRKADIRIFSAIEFENAFSEGDTRINLYEYSLECPIRFSPFVHLCPKTLDNPNSPPEVCTIGTLAHHIQGKSILDKLLLYFAIDRKILARIFRIRGKNSHLIRMIARLLESF